MNIEIERLTEDHTERLDRLQLVECDLDCINESVAHNVRLDARLDGSLASHSTRRRQDPDPS
jgi:hypothetical protein